MLKCALLCHHQVDTLGPLLGATVVQNLDQLITRKKIRRSEGWNKIDTPCEKISTDEKFRMIIEEIREREMIISVCTNDPIVPSPPHARSARFTLA
jgi:hypothetical protein